MVLEIKEIEGKVVSIDTDELSIEKLQEVYQTLEANNNIMKGQNTQYENQITNIKAQIENNNEMIKLTEERRAIIGDFLASKNALPQKEEDKPKMETIQTKKVQEIKEESAKKAE